MARPQKGQKAAGKAARKVAKKTAKKPAKKTAKKVTKKTAGKKSRIADRKDPFQPSGCEIHPAGRQQYARASARRHSWQYDTLLYR